MPEQTFPYCAMHYANQWFGKDREYCQVLNNGTRQQKRNTLKKAGAFYRVARNFKTEYEKERGEERFDRLIDMLGNVRRQPYQNNPVGRVQAFATRLSQHFGGDQVLSGASKYLWLRLKSPIVIYDSNVRTALELPPDCGYADYFVNWRNAFERYTDQIDGACCGLRHARRYVIDGRTISEDDFAALTDENWFKERVLDMFLWFRGLDNA